MQEVENWEREHEEKKKEIHPIPTKNEMEGPNVVYAKVKGGTYTACMTDKIQKINVNAG
jgi:hypothetical protein